MADYIMELRKLVGTRPLIMPGANVIILDREGKVLLHHRSDMDLWGLPGGFCELGETVEETAAREVFEEVGLTCKRLKLFNVYSGEKQHFKYPHGDEVYNVTVTFMEKFEMNKADLVTSIAEKSGLPKKDSEAALNAFVTAVEEGLTKGEKVVLVGFGTFEAKKRAARKGRNPQTKKEILIPASTAPVFKAGKTLKEKVQ